MDAVKVNYKQGVNLVEAFEYVLKYTGWNFINRHLLS